MSHFPCHWVPSPTPDSSLSQKLLQAPLGGESGGTFLEHEAGRSWLWPSHSNSLDALGLWLLHRLRVKVLGATQTLYFLHRPLARLLVTGSPRGHVKRGPKTSLACRAYAAGHRPGRGDTLTLSWEHRPNTPPNTPRPGHPAPDTSLSWQLWLPQVEAGVLGASRSPCHSLMSVPVVVVAGSIRASQITLSPVLRLHERSGPAGLRGCGLDPLKVTPAPSPPP